MSLFKWPKILEPVSLQFAGMLAPRLLAPSSHARCSTSNGQFVKDCGADIVLFYDGGPNFDFSAALNGRPIDAVIDCVGGDEYFQSACRCAYPLGAYKGRFVTIVGPEPDVQKLGAGMFASFAFKLATRYALPILLNQYL